MATNMEYFEFFLTTYIISICFGGICSLEIHRKSFQSGEHVIINCEDYQNHSIVQLVNISIPSPDMTCPYSTDVAVKLHELLDESSQRCYTETTCDITSSILEPTYRKIKLYNVCRDDKFGCNYNSCSWTLVGFVFLTSEQQTTSEPLFTDTNREKTQVAYSNINGSYLRSPPLLSGPKCLTLQYSTVSAKMLLFLSNMGNTKLFVVILAHSLSSEIILNKINIDGMENSTVILMTIAIENVFSMHVNIYNISLEEGTCNNEMTIYVDFDVYPGIWWNKSSTDTRYSWIRRNGNEPSIYFGKLRPFFDHSTPKGYGKYLTMEVINFAYALDAKEQLVKATFESPYYFGNDRTDGRSWTIGCLQFWYYMYGDKNSTLVVWKKFSDGNRKILSSVQNNEPSGLWKKHSLTLANLTDENIKIVFEGVISKNRSSIAIDDISIKNGRCPEEKHILYTVHSESPCVETSSTSSFLSCVSQTSDENRVNIGFEPDILQTNTAEYNKCKNIEKEMELRFNDECKGKTINDEINECAKQMQKDYKQCMIIPSTIIVDFICLDNSENTSSLGSTLENQFGSTPKISTVAENTTSLKELDKSFSSSSSKGIVIGVTCGILFVAVTAFCAVLVMKRSIIFQKCKGRTTSNETNTTYQQQYYDIHQNENIEHVYNTTNDERGTDKKSDNSLYETLVSGANDRDEYNVLQEMGIYDQITQDKANNMTNGNYLRSQSNSKQILTEQSKEYANLDQNEAGNERTYENQEGAKCSDEKYHNYTYIEQ